METFDLVGDESFDAETDLNPTAKGYYDDLMAIDITTTPSYTGIADATNDDATGTGLQDTIESRWTLINALLSAFRILGDLDILDVIDTLMEELATPIITNEYWLAGAGAASHGQCVLGALVNQMAYVYDVNTGLTGNHGINYGTRATQWQDYWTNTYAPAFTTWPDSFYIRSLRHRTMQTIQAMHYWYLWNGDINGWYDADGAPDTDWPGGASAYRTRCLAEDRLSLNSAAGVNANGLDLTGSRYRWDHLVPYEYQSGASLGWEASTYARYTLGSILDLALHGVYPFAKDKEIARYTATVEFLMQDGVDSVRNSVDSEGGGSSLTAGQWRISSLIGYGRFSNTILALATADYENAGATNMWYPAWMLEATA